VVIHAEIVVIPEEVTEMKVVEVVITAITQKQNMMRV